MPNQGICTANVSSVRRYDSTRVLTKGELTLMRRSAYDSGG